MIILPLLMGMRLLTIRSILSWRCSAVRTQTNLGSFGIGIRDNNKPQFASGTLLLVIALARGTLFNIKSLGDLAQYDLRAGPTTEIPLRWKTDALNKPVFRNRFCYFFRLILITTSYSKNATVHDIHRELGKKIEDQDMAPVSQLYAHRSESTYPEHYQAYCSLINMVGGVLNDEEETYHIAYFQDYRQFRKIGLPFELPTKKKEAILGRPELVEARNRIQELIKKADKNTCTRALALIMPELGCLAATLSSTKPLSFDQKLLFAEQLLTQCRRDYDVIYLPNEAPADDGRCPVGDCREDIQK
ncbi:hypothetical protein BDV29DRAFT_199846 [Aspergillus leporis]|uniref:Uncharacterized protein n=1 Tax=Aspergillus leporis TaxID=41062 RepID=A0A5N5WJ28_9EURO|nr:hypothetical protein BDV29DRAFT_199846 [Aspergillus leporis]